MTTRRGLTVGDALSITALLLFALTWTACAFWALHQGDPDVPLPGGPAAVLLLLLIFGPPISALVMVGSVIQGGTQ